MTFGNISYAATCEISMLNNIFQIR